MPDTYHAAAARHYRDALYLKDRRDVLSHPNADQLFGFAAECAIKFALVNSDVNLSDASAGYWLHIDKLWDRVHVSGLNRRFAALASLLGSQARPFANWTTRQRYAADAAVSPRVCEEHATWAKRIVSAVGLLGTRAGG
jgi:hypothetical protein